MTTGRCIPRITSLRHASHWLRSRQSASDLLHAFSVMVLKTDMESVMSLSDHVVVLNFGRVIASGAPTAVQRDAAVIDAYLGAA